jgi:hypothetical protein
VPPSASSLPADLTEIEGAIHRSVRSVGPDLRTERKWASDWYAGTDLILCVSRFQRHVGVEFWRGSTVGDPTHLLEGTGKNLRHVKVRSIAEARTRPFLELIRAAILLDRKTPKRTR